ncbi:enoyl-CoA hydratase-related protein [Tomitella biformata]|uniref:enoyl-CoA hydratase-related protein n=1 Tax=Tomitella biformata TaxID=630403 RepID=UPI000465767C|nr:enoyl-CoA hydratase-related protein [Tomitella biformata]
MTVIVERRGPVLVITINRPEARNAVNAAVAEGIGDALELAHTDPRIRAVVLTGAGVAAFCGGGDLKAMAAGESLDPADPVKAGWGFGGVCEHPIDKPIIAAVNGFAVGGGAQMALACDLLVAGQSAQFSLPEVRNGLVAASGGPVWLAKWVPRAIAMEILLLGDRFDAAQAQEWGLVNRVVPDGQVLPVALEIAAAIAARAPLAVQATKRVVAGVVDGVAVADLEAWSRSKVETLRNRATEDAQEGPRAFAEKRPSVWVGR